jgi:hypothetical protein
MQDTCSASGQLCPGFAGIVSGNQTCLNLTLRGVSDHLATIHRFRGRNAHEQQRFWSLTPATSSMPRATHDPIPDLADWSEFRQNNPDLRGTGPMY